MTEIFETDLCFAPTSCHGSRQAYNRAIAMGWNKSVAKVLKGVIFGQKWQFPVVPDYQSCIAVCTCKNRKKPMIKVVDIENPNL